MLSVCNLGLWVLALFALVVTTQSVDPKQKDAKLPWKLTNLEHLARKTDCSARSSKTLMNRYKTLQIYHEFKSEIDHAMMHYLVRCTQKLMARDYGSTGASSGMVSMWIYDDQLSGLKNFISMKSAEFEINQPNFNRLNVGRAIMPFIKVLGFNGRIESNETVKSYRARFNNFVKQSIFRPCEATRLNSQPQHPDFVELLKVAQVLGKSPDLRPPGQLENMSLCNILLSNEPYDLHLAASFTPTELELQYFGPGAELLSLSESKRGLELIEAVFVARRNVGGEDFDLYNKHWKLREASECDKSCRHSCFELMKEITNSATSPNMMILFNASRINEQEQYCHNIKESFFKGLTKYMADNGLEDPLNLSKFMKALIKEAKAIQNKKLSLSDIDNVRKSYPRTVILLASSISGRFPENPPEQTIAQLIGDDCRKLDDYGLLKWNVGSVELERWRVRQEFGKLAVNWVIFSNICRIHLYEADWVQSKLSELHPNVNNFVPDDSSDNESTPEASPIRNPTDQAVDN